MNYIHLLLGLFLEEYFLEYIFLIIQKKLQNFFKISLYYYVKVYIKYFKIYVIFKNFEVYL
jgi:hypothetical protein